MYCETCYELQKGQKLPTPSSIHTPKDFNEAIGLDGVKWTNREGKTFTFGHIYDEATGFNLGKRVPTENTEEMLGMMKDIWIRWAGYPEYMYVDPHGSYTSETWRKTMQAMDVKTKLSAGDAHWQLGRTEIHGHIIKDMMTAMDVDKAIITEEEFDEALRECFTAKNALSRHRGYSPELAVLGKMTKLPGSLCGDEGIGAHQLAVEDTPEGLQFREKLARREMARKAFIKADNQDSSRRAILRRPQPIRTQWTPGTWIMYFRQTSNIKGYVGKWHGPGQNIVQESNKVVWVSHAGHLIRCGPQHLRMATMRETKRMPFASPTYQDLPEKIPTPQDTVTGPTAFIDLTNQPGPPVEDEDGTQSSPGPEDEPEAEQPQAEVPTGPEESPADLPTVDASLIPIPDAEEVFQTFGDDVEPEPIYHMTDEVCLHMEIPIHQDDISRWREDGTHDTAFLINAAKKAKAEVKMKDLTLAEKKLFDQAKGKEVKAWLDTRTVRRLLRNQLDEKQILRTRWVLSWKKNEGDTSAKARLVVLGFEDPDIDTVPNDSPTLGKDGRNLILQHVASSKWTLLSFDIKTAFLRGRGDGRKLGLEPPREMREMMQLEPDEIVALDGGAYGRIDGPYLWFKEFSHVAKQLGFIQAPMDACVFALPKAGGGTHGMLGMHVDDGIGGGDRYFQGILHRLAAIFPFGAYKEKDFIFTGIHYHQEADGSIRYDQTEYVQQIESIHISRERRKQGKDLVTETERTELRAINGAMSYAGIHTRPDICAKIGRLQTSVNVATVETLLEANRVLHEAKRFQDTFIVIPSLPLEEVTFCAFSDASFSTKVGEHSYQGALIFSTTGKLHLSEKAPVCPMAWTSKKIPRVVRSTLSAEAMALSNSLDRLSWIRLFWRWLLKPDDSWKTPSETLKQMNTAVTVTDCKSVYDICSRTAIPNCAEYRTTLECLLVRERLGENTKIRWINSKAQLADCLTKPMEGHALRDCLETGAYSLFDEHRVLQERSEKRNNLGWYREVAATQDR